VLESGEAEDVEEDTSGEPAGEDRFIAALKDTFDAQEVEAQDE
jgi:hypothetical protein